MRKERNLQIKCFVSTFTFDIPPPHFPVPANSMQFRNYIRSKELAPFDREKIGRGKKFAFNLPCTHYWIASFCNQSGCFFSHPQQQTEEVEGTSNKQNKKKLLVHYRCHNFNAQTIEWLCSFAFFFLFFFFSSFPISFADWFFFSQFDCNSIKIEQIYTSKMYVETLVCLCNWKDKFLSCIRWKWERATKKAHTNVRKRKKRIGKFMNSLKWLQFSYIYMWITFLPRHISIILMDFHHFRFISFTAYTQALTSFTFAAFAWSLSKSIYPKFGRGERIFHYN